MSFLMRGRRLRSSQSGLSHYGLRKTHRFILPRAPSPLRRRHTGTLYQSYTYLLFPPQKLDTPPGENASPHYATLLRRAGYDELRRAAMLSSGHTLIYGYYVITLLIIRVMFSSSYKFYFTARRLSRHASFQK